jgi:hypothetical protein
LRRTGDDVCGAYTGYRLVSGPRRSLERVWSIPGNDISFGEFLFHTPFPTSIPLLKRDALLVVGGFDETLVACHDKELWIRLAQKFRFIGVEGVYADYWIHGQQISTNLARKLLARTQVWLKHQRTYRQHTDAAVQMLSRLILLNLAQNDLVTARRWLETALDLAPNDVQLNAYRNVIEGMPGQFRDRAILDAFPKAGEITLYW